MTRVYDDRACELGEGPLWHPLRKQLFWFDILGRKLLTRDGKGPRGWAMPEMFSAAGWVDDRRLLAASETGLWLLDLVTGRPERLAPIEADNPATRSNDGRADPWGGFWIGTMGKKAETGAGAIYRYFQGDVRRLFAPISIPNAISFTPDRRFAHFADSKAAKVWRVALDEDGWPAGEPATYLDLTGQPGDPDGAVCDSEGNLWLAEWGAARVACYSPAGEFLSEIRVPGLHASCPAFGGDDFRTLFVTSAREHLAPDMLAAEPMNGCTFSTEVDTTGLPEYRAEP